MYTFVPNKLFGQFLDIISPENGVFLKTFNFEFCLLLKIWVKMVDNYMSKILSVIYWQTLLNQLLKQLVI